MNKTDRNHGFTLVELLVVMAIVSLLIGVLLPVLGKARESAECAVELSGARTLSQAVMGRAADRDGAIIAGYTANEPAYERHGNLIAPGSVEALRYPWRLVEYLDYGLTGSVLVNEQAEKLGSPPAGASFGDPAYAGWLYNVSVDPSFGMNLNNVGGNEASPGQNNPGLVTRIEDAASPSRLIVFASAYQAVLSGFDADSGTVLYDAIPGFFRVTAPNDWLASYRWQASAYSPVIAPGQTGNVDFRCAEAAAVSNLDGSALFLKFDELRDMTRWNNDAAMSGDPDYQHPPFGSL